MATSLAHDAKHEDWAEPTAAPGDDSRLTRGQWLLWAVVGFVLLSAFLLLLVDDYGLRNVIAVN